jgi:hypothetical protein
VRIDGAERRIHMLERVRRLLRNDRPAGRDDDGLSTPPGEERLAEGVYAGAGRITHYALEGRTRTLCGKPPTGLHRWASSWSFVEPAKRCKRCDALIGERANERHGAPTLADTMLFGVPPAGLSPRQRAEFEAAWERDAPRRRGDPPPPPGATFTDPPFVYAKDPARRRGSSESTYDRVINDVYTRVGKGKRWHRIYETHAPNAHPVLAPYGRTFLLPCGNTGSDFERDDDGEFFGAPLRTEPPPPAEMCKACAQSDAKHGKLGELPRDRWDR